MTENQAQVDEVFDEALCRAGQDRARYLDEVCGGRLELRRRVERLLSAVVEAGSFLETPAQDPSPLVNQPPIESPGAVIGPYKLMEQLGEGGMGLVFVAEQQRPVRRKVALKVIKPGMDTRQVIARFEAERQALALMDHPNIAKVLDGGTTENGRPFFVMDLVKGPPITQFCDNNRLTTRERLALFLSVCEAVQHAHQKGIIHRDLKPSNVLVASHDGTPVVKVIDFGVAKAIGQQLTEKTVYTQLTQLVGTPLYMSPEQAGQSSLDIDTRTDVYALGVLLYELLTGLTPFDGERLRQAGYDEMQRIIREEEPARPSTRMSTLGQAAATVLANRQSDARRLKQLFRGELDWIVMKTLEKDRNRRYESASALAADLQRYLHDEPVQACPPSAWYRLRKFVRRNIGPVLAASVVILALVVGIIGTTVGLIRARIAEADAARKADEKTEALTEAKTNLADAMAAVDQFLTRLGDERLANVPQTEPIRREFLQDALKFYQKILARKSDDPVIRREAARAYRRMGGIHFWLGEDSDASDAYRKAIAMMEELGAASSRYPEERVELVNCHLDYSWALSIHLSKADEYVRQRRRAVELAESLVADFPKLPESQTTWISARIFLALALIGSQPDEAERILQESLPLVDDDARLLWTHTNLGHLCGSKQRWPEAAEHFRHALKYSERFLEQTPKAPWAQRQVGLALHFLASCLAANQQTVEAEKCVRLAIPRFDQLAREYPTGPHYRRELAEARVAHAALLKQLGKSSEAEHAYRLAADVYEKLADDFPTMPTFRQSAFDQRMDLCRFLVQGGRPLEAQEMLGKATMASQKLPGDFRGRLIYKRRLVESHLELARLLKAGGKTSEAQTAFGQAVAVQQALEKDFADKPEFRWELASAHLSAADRLREDGRAEEAEPFYHLAEAHLQHLVARVPGDVDEAYLNALWALVTSPDVKFHEFTRKMAEKTVELSPTGGPLITLGWACYRTGDWKAALEAAEKAKPLRNGGDCADWFLLAMVHWKLGDQEQARHWYDKGAQLMENRIHPDWPHFRAEAAALLGIQEQPSKEKGKTEAKAPVR